MQHVFQHKSNHLCNLNDILYPHMYKVKTTISMYYIKASRWKNKSGKILTKIFEYFYQIIFLFYRENSLGYLKRNILDFGKLFHFIFSIHSTRTLVFDLECMHFKRVYKLIGRNDFTVEYSLKLHTRKHPILILIRVKMFRTKNKYQWNIIINAF
jgi:hypothetical protein